MVFEQTTHESKNAVELSRLLGIWAAKSKQRCVRSVCENMGTRFSRAAYTNTESWNNGEPVNVRVKVI